MQNFLKPIFLACFWFGYCCCCYAFNLFLQKRHIVYICVSGPPFELLIIQIFICLSSQCWLLAFFFLSFFFVVIRFPFVWSTKYTDAPLIGIALHIPNIAKFKTTVSNQPSTLYSVRLWSITLAICCFSHFFLVFCILGLIFTMKKSLTSNHFKHTTMLQTFGWSTFLCFSFYSQHLYAINKISPNKLKDANRFVCPHMIGSL